MEVVYESQSNSVATDDQISFDGTVSESIST